ncbi:hypothetical protein BC828DRAFT_33526 [Blastocladiella britannica]|nr:hypothetical protein BC828DRAFT_33526 [Blastocladiella britannica]
MRSPSCNWPKLQFLKYEFIFFPAPLNYEHSHYEEEVFPHPFPLLNQFFHPRSSSKLAHQKQIRFKKWLPFPLLPPSPRSATRRPTKLPPRNLARHARRRCRRWLRPRARSRTTSTRHSSPRKPPNRRRACPTWTTSLTWPLARSRLTRMPTTRPFRLQGPFR